MADDAAGAVYAPTHLWRTSSIFGRRRDRHGRAKFLRDLAPSAGSASSANLTGAAPENDDAAAAAVLCESIQFVSGLALRGRELVLTYGVNDCEARIGRLRLDAVTAMLVPL